MNKYIIKAYIYQSLFMDSMIGKQDITPQLVQQRMLLDGQNAPAEDIRKYLDEIYMSGDIDMVYVDKTKAVYRATLDG